MRVTQTSKSKTKEETLPPDTAKTVNTALHLLTSLSPAKPVPLKGRFSLNHRKTAADRLHP